VLPRCLIWGELIPSNVSFAEGLGVRDNYAATQGCAGATSPSLVSPCVSYNGCARELDWCAIPGMGHSIWAQAASALWQFIDASAPAGLPDPIFADDFDPAGSAQIRGTNVAGMEMAYQNCDQAGGPIEGTQYPRHDERLIDYFASKHMTTLRFLFSSECMEQVLNGPIPASQTGRYKTYFDNYKRIVDYATNVKGLRVVIEPWDSNTAGGAGGARYRGNVVGSASVPNSAFADFWSRMATIFGGNVRVDYGLINEPNDMSTMARFSAAQAPSTRSAAPGRRSASTCRAMATARRAHGPRISTTPPRQSDRMHMDGSMRTGSASRQRSRRQHGCRVHTYLDTDRVAARPDHLDHGGSRSRRGRRQQAFARIQGLPGEIGYAGANNAPQARADFIAYRCECRAGVFLRIHLGFAGGDPLWWRRCREWWRPLLDLATSRPPTRAITEHGHDRERFLTGLAARAVYALIGSVRGAAKPWQGRPADPRAPAGGEANGATCRSRIDRTGRANFTAAYFDPWPLRAPSLFSLHPCPLFSLNITCL
jgi:endoglucanase